MIILKNTLCKIQTSDSIRYKSSNENVALCPNNCNVTTKYQPQGELLFDIIKRMEEPKIKTRCLYKLKLKDKVIKSRVQPFSLKQILKTYEEQNSNLSKPIIVKELRNYIQIQNLNKQVS